MANLSLFSTKEYQVPIKLYDYMMSDLRNQMRREVKKEAILRDLEQQKKDVYAALKEAYANLGESIEAQKVALKEKYGTVTYEDPAAEILRRQDIDMRLKTMDHAALAAYVAELEPGLLTEYEYNALLIQIQQMNGTAQADRISWKLTELSRAVDFRTPWEKVPEWEALEQLEGEMKVARADTLWYPTADGQNYKPVDINARIKDALIGY